MRHITKSDWTAALRSGKYRQTKGKLESRAGDCCCLGVLVAEMDVPKERNRLARCYVYDFSELVISGDNVLKSSSNIPNSILQRMGLGLSGSKQQILVGMNDTGISFSEIADYIDALPHVSAVEEGFDK